MMSKGNFSFKFDKMGETVTGGFLIGVEIVPKLEMETNLANQSEPKEIKVNINIAHRWLGHVSESMTRATAKLYRWKLTGKWQACEHCTQAKIRQQNIGHGSKQPSKVKGERLYIDISSIKGRSYGGTKFWNLIVDEATRMKWSICLKQKSDLGKEMVKFLRNCMRRTK